MRLRKRKARTGADTAGLREANSALNRATKSVSQAKKTSQDVNDTTSVLARLDERNHFADLIIKVLVGGGA